VTQQTAQDRYFRRIAQLTGGECVAYSTEEYAAFVEGRLRPGDARAIEAHLAICEECRWLVEQLREEAAQAAGGAPVVRVRPRSALAGRPAWISAAAVAVVAVALCVHLLRGGFSPVQPEGRPGGVIIAEGTGTPEPAGDAVSETAPEAVPEPADSGVAPSSVPPSAPPVVAPAMPRSPVPDRRPQGRRAPAQRRSPSRPSARPAAPVEMLAGRPSAPSRPEPSTVPPAVPEGPADNYTPAPPPMVVHGRQPGVLALQDGDPKAVYATPQSDPAPRAANPVDSWLTDDEHARSIKERMFSPLWEHAPVSRDVGGD